MQIRALETELGVTLFNRTQRSVALTQSGNAQPGEARHILARVEQAVLMTRRASRGEIGKLAIGISAWQTITCFPSYCASSAVPSRWST